MEKEKKINYENLSIAREIHEEAKKIVAAMDKRGISDIRFTCEDKDIEDKYEKQARAKELARVLGFEE